MKTVFTTDQCAHVWAAQSQKEGRNTGRSLWFDGPTIYSYGTHYPLATFVRPDVVFVNTTGYSNTTAKQIGKVRGALSGLPVRVIHEAVRSTCTPREMITALVGSYVQCLEKASKARTYTDMHLNDSTAIRENIAFLAQAFGETVPTLPEYDRAALLLKAKVQRSERAADEVRRATAFANEQRERANKEAKALTLFPIWADAWRSHGAKPYPEDYRPWGNLPTALRISRDGLSVETSRGASVPLMDAIRLWRRIQECYAQCEAWPDIPGAVAPIGAFQLRKIRADGTAIVGCHTLTYAETSALAASQGW